MKTNQCTVGRVDIQPASERFEDAMTRREVIGSAVFCIGGGLSFRGLTEAFAATPGKPPEPPPVTSYVADFITNTRYTDVPAEVIDLAKKSILDGIGLALCGSVAQ